MEENTALSGRDVSILINGRPLLQAESVLLRSSTLLHSVRSCFNSSDIAHIKGKREYKLNLTGIRFRRPFENCNFCDLDNFTVEVVLEGLHLTLRNCLWDDFQAAADKNRFREHISITALTLEKEEADERNEGI